MIGAAEVDIEGGITVTTEDTEEEGAEVVENMMERGRGRGGMQDKRDDRGRDDRRERGGTSQRDEERGEREGSASRGREIKRDPPVTEVVDRGTPSSASNGSVGKETDSTPRPQRQTPRKKEGEPRGDRVGVGEVAQRGGRGK